MEFFSLLWKIFAFVIMTTFETMANVADEVIFTLEDNEVYGKIAKYLSICVGNFYFWQALAVIGFCHYLRRLADKFPAPPIIATDSQVDVGPSMQQLLEEKERAVNDAASKIDDLDRKNAGLRAKVSWLESEVDFLANDRYALVREKWTLENRLGDFNSWPEFRIEYDQLTTEFIAMKRQRAREHILQERTLEIAKQTKIELAAMKRAEAMSKIAHSEELEQVQQERDEAKEKYQILLATTTAAAATTTPAVTAAAVTATATSVVKGNFPGDIALQEENTRLTLALRSQSSLSKKSSELERMKSLLIIRSNHSALQLKTAASTIASLEEDKAKAEVRIAELEGDLQEANEKAEEMEEMYMATFASEGEGEKEEEEEEEEEGEGSREQAETSWLLKQLVEMRKKGQKESGSTAGGSEAGESGSEDEEEAGEEDGDDDGNDDAEEEDDGGNEGEENQIHDENEDLFKDMMGRP